MILNLVEYMSFIKLIYDKLESITYQVKRLLGWKGETFIDESRISIDLNKPVMINKYRIIIKNFKYGISGIVGVVQNINTLELYACKKFRKRLGANTEFFVKKLHDEYSIESMLSHPNILKAVEIFDFEEDWYEILELCARGDLFDLVQKKPLSIELIEHFFRQLMFGVFYLHKNGIFHRDIKLENLLITKEYNLKIADFGIADVIKLEVEKEKRRCQGFYGSPPYLAPEIYTAYKNLQLFTEKATQSIYNHFNDKDKNSYTYDGEKADIWSCGITLYIMLFNFMPFSASNTTCHGYNHFIDHREDKDGLLDRLPISLKDLILGMLEPDPDKRFDTEMVLDNEWFKKTKPLESKDLEFLKKCDALKRS